MELEKAYSRIEEIHGLLTKGEVFRGYRAMPVASTGLLAICGTLIADRFLAAMSSTSFVLYWGAIALLGFSLCTADLLLENLHRGSLVLRRQTLVVLGQFAPNLLVGAILGLAFCRLEQADVRLLPGLWGLCFGMGILASRPFLPRAIGWVGLWYLGSGATTLLFLSTASLSNRSMALIFGVGQVLAAAVIVRDASRQRAEFPADSSEGGPDHGV